jgi:beta-lactamase regulating signal transducer with metallopeptidase domain
MRELLNVGLANAVVVIFLAIPAFGVSRWAKRPALAHVLWLFILIKLVTPPLWHIPLALPASQTASLEKTASVETTIVERAPVTEGTATEPAIEVPLLLAQPVNEPPVVESAVAATAPPVPLAIGPTPLPANTIDLPLEIPWQTIVGFWWLAGSSIVFGLTIWRLSAFARCLHRVQPALASMQALSEELSQSLGLKFAPRVGIAPIRMAPLVWGLGSWSRVIIPAELWQTLDAEQRAMLLVHELAHLRRGDHWVRWLEIVVRCVYWWHPVVWLAGREMREAEEQCCDAWAVWAVPHAAKAYARALVDTVDFLSERSLPLPVGASGIGQFQDLRRRLIMIMRGTTPRKLSASTLAGLVVLGAALIVLGPSFGQQTQSEDLAPAVDPFQQPVPVAPRATRPPTAESDDPTKTTEIARLRKQQADLQQAMDALARSLEQTNRQLNAVQGDRSQPEDVVPTPRAPRDTARARATPPRPTAPRPPAADMRPSEDQPRPRISRERPIEERLSRLEEQMSQIANDLHALRSNSLAPMPPAAVTPGSRPLPTVAPRARPQPSANPFGQPEVAPPVRSVSPDIADPAVPPSDVPAVPAPPAPVRPRRPSSDTTALPVIPADPSGTLPPLPAVPAKPN